MSKNCGDSMEFPFHRLTERQRQLLPLEDRSEFIQSKARRTWVVPAISSHTHKAPGRSYSHGDNQRPSSKTSCSSSKTSFGKVGQKACRIQHHQSSATVSISSTMSSRKKKSKKSEKKCFVQYTRCGTTSDYQKMRVSLTGRSLVPDPYLELNRDLHNPLKSAANSPAWMVVATQRLRDRLKASTGSYQNPCIYQSTSSDQSLAKSSDESSQHDVVTSTSDRNRRSRTDLVDEKAKGAKDDQPLWEVYGPDGQVEFVTDEMDEDDEEEGGLPQAVRSLAMPAPIHLSQREVTRERQKARMEDIARSVSPELLIEYLTTCGFLNHNYANHSRTGSGNHNLKNGKKKQTAHLITLLSKQSSIFK